jgi:hypothetical protein
MARNTILVKAALFLAVVLLSTHSASAAWGVYVSVRNDCEYTADITIDSDGDQWKVNLDPGESETVYLCNSACTGFLGATETYYYDISGVVTADESYNSYTSEVSWLGVSKCSFDACRDELCGVMVEGGFEDYTPTLMQSGSISINGFDATDKGADIYYVCLEYTAPSSVS